MPTPTTLTPRSDAVKEFHTKYHQGTLVPYAATLVPIEFARELETQLNECKKQNETLTQAMRESYNDAYIDGGAWTYNDWQEIRRRLQVQLNECAEALRMLVEAECAPDPVQHL